MLEAITLDQLRAFIAAAEEGSFSAAGRKLRRAQSVVPTPSIGGAQRISLGARL
ncbi:MAG TPA: LysR family transcriptional regulator [Steroidobacteraceae bacterium]|jgi:DNA-binding transcriptional LysR family regulator|nr:LysR family transcriptional regulator [Steroidobacteraceae bacterium]